MNETTEEMPPFVLTDKQYNFLKWIVGIVLPALGALYFGVAKIWNLPAGEQVLGTLIVLQAFLGALLGISSKRYKDSDARFDGVIVTKETSTGKVASLEFDEHPQDILDRKDEVLLKVK